MTRVTIYLSGEEIRGYKCEGHAQFAEHGKDIVCAAASMLSTNTANAILTYTQDRPEIEVNSETPCIACRYRRTPSAEGALLLKTFALGVETIMDQYGKEFLRVDYAQEC